MNLNRTFPLVLLLLCAAAGNALGKGEKSVIMPQTVEVSGLVRMVGSSPVTSLVISGEDREWYVEPEEQEKLVSLQQQAVTVRAKEYYRDLVFANGSPAGRHYFLKDIDIIVPKHQ
ncbi:MAG: hypothetical protein FWH38_03775 [Treponema sp.]|nr:hypothetical protein [Treponema sp.]